MADRDDACRALLADLSAGLAAGKEAVVVLVTTTADHVPLRLEMQSTPVSAVTLAETATFVLERAIPLARQTRDGSADHALPHLEDAHRSLLAAACVDGVPLPTIGRA